MLKFLAVLVVSLFIAYVIAIAWWPLFVLGLLVCLALLAIFRKRS